MSAELYKVRDYNQVTKPNLKFIYCGNIQSQKGVLHLLEAFDILSKKINYIRISLDLYGLIFDDIKQLPKSVKYKGVLGFEDRLVKMSEYDCLVLPSESEGMPMVLLESMAIGLPFICTNVGGISDLVGKDYGLFCSPNKHSLEYVILNFINEYNPIAKNISKFNNKRYNSYFNFKMYRDNLVDLLDFN